MNYRAAAIALASIALLIASRSPAHGQTLAQPQVMLSDDGDRVVPPRPKVERKTKSPATASGKRASSPHSPRTAARGENVRSAFNSSSVNGDRSTINGVEVINTPPAMGLPEVETITPPPLVKTYPRPKKTRSSGWHFRDWALPLRFDAGATFGVPAGFETRCQVESCWGAPDNEVHLSTYYTLVDYNQQGVRFYYDKEDRTLSFSTFPSPGPHLP